MDKDTTEAVVNVAKERSSNEEEIKTLESGVRVTIHSVAASLIDQVTARIKDPDVPTWHNEEKGRDESNPNDPQYLSELQAADRKRGIAAMDAIVMFGFDLVDGVPEDDLWVKKLSILGVDVNADDPIELEFAYKKYIAISPEDINLVTSKSGISQEALQEAESSFRSPS
jgi:hypothetical protein